jgi:ketosteroid isomerase-like protein
VSDLIIIESKLKGMKNINTVGFLAGLALMASCSNCPEVETLNIADVKAEIIAIEKGYSDASTNNDVDGVLAYYSEDAKSLAPNEVLRVGKSEIRAATLKEMEDDEGNVSVMEVQNVWAAGEIAVEVGTYTVTDSEGQLVSLGKYMSLFEKIDGKYVCVRDIWNSDLEHESDDDDDDEDDEDESEDDIEMEE